LRTHDKKAFPKDLPEGLKPRLRLFLSVDLVGSTAFKQQGQSWRPAIMRFYRDFDYTVYNQYRTFNRQSNQPLPTPEFWKSNGDELLYTCELINVEQANDTLHVWLEALNGYRAEAMRGGLDVKSTAWIGLFPSPNAEVFFRRGAIPFRADNLNDAQLLQSEIRDAWYANRRQDITRDFVGPSIDTGFRLSGWASPRRFIISVDLAFLLTSSYTSANEPLPLHLSGRAKLKGVIDNEPYPMIWIPVGGRGRTEEAPDATVGRHLADSKTLRGYCEAIIEQNYRFITPLFLSDTNYEDFDWVPPYIIQDIRAQWRNEQAYREKSEAA